MAIWKAIAETTKERIESTPPVISTLIVSMLESPFGITKTSLEVEVKASYQPIKEGVNASSEVEFGSHPIEEGKADPEEEPLCM